MLFQCIPHSLIKNKVLAHVIATLTQLSTQKEVFNKDSGPIFADFCTAVSYGEFMGQFGFWAKLCVGKNVIGSSI